MIFGALLLAASSVVVDIGPVGVYADCTYRAAVAVDDRRSDLKRFAPEVAKRCHVQYEGFCKFQRAGNHFCMPEDEYALEALEAERQGRAKRHP